MAETKTPSHSRIRVALAQFCLAHDIEVDELYGALGVEAAGADPEALAHMAGVTDGMKIAAARIRQHGLDKWTKDI